MEVLHIEAMESVEGKIDYSHILEAGPGAEYSMGVAYIVAWWDLHWLARELLESLRRLDSWIEEMISVALEVLIRLMDLVGLEDC